MITHIDNIQKNVAQFEIREGDTIRPQTLEKIKNGEVSRFGSVERIAKAYGSSIGELMVTPGEDASRWADSSTSTFCETFAEYLDCSKIKSHQLGYAANIPSTNFTNFIVGRRLPSLRTAQNLADFWNIEVADLFIPPRAEDFQAIEEATREFATSGRRKLRNKPIDNEKVMETCISNAEWLRGNLEAIADRYGATERDKLRYRNIEKLCDAEKFASFYGMTIGEALLRPGIDTEWYRDASTLYLSYNLERALKESPLTTEKIAEKTSYCTADYVYRFAKGLKTPSLKDAQELANALGMEIADLFLPPDGTA